MERGRETEQFEGHITRHLVHVKPVPCQPTGLICLTFDPLSSLNVTGDLMGDVRPLLRRHLFKPFHVFCVNTCFICVTCLVGAVGQVGL